MRRMRLLFTEVKGSLLNDSATAGGAPLPAFQVDNNFPNSFRPSIAVIIAVLVTMFSLTFLLLLYAKHCKQNAMAVAAREDAGSNHAAAAAAARPRASGVDRAIVESLPFFKFSSLKGMKEGLECSVCLNVFEESEMLRLLPKCKHAFHVECVDKWLESHSTCPLCRHKVELDDVLLAEDMTCRKPLGASGNSTDFQFREEGGVEFFVQRETEADGERSFRSSRFNIDSVGSSRQEAKNWTRSGSSGRKEGIGCLDKFSSSGRKEGIGCLDKFGSSGRKEGLLLAEADIVDYERFVQRFAHRIIVSDVLFQHRWSDFKSSDLDFLDSRMLRTGSRPFSSGRLPDSKPYSGHGLGRGAPEKISKIKDEMERKRRLEKQASRLKNSASLADVELPSNRVASNNGARLPLSSPGRSMSEITSYDRHARSRTASMPLVSKPTPRDEEKLRRWFSLARSTLHWFARRDKRPSAFHATTP